MFAVHDQRRRTRREHSAGGAVLSFRDGAIHLAMIATRNATRWGLPKGAVSQGETSPAAALREVQEETGLSASIIESLDTIEYFFRAGEVLVQKTVDFYLMRYERGELVPQLSEVDDVAWIPLDEAVERASFDSEKKLLTALRERCSRLEPSERERLFRDP